MKVCHFCGGPGADREISVLPPSARRLSDSAKCFICENGPTCGSVPPTVAPRCWCRGVAELRAALEAGADRERIAALAEELSR